jgi:hypothetical protein
MENAGFPIFRQLPSALAQREQLVAAIKKIESCCLGSDMFV